METRMNERNLQADYVIVGAGAVGMAMADTLVAETSASVILADRRDRPGGHWNDAYPFVRLHSPSITYGVNSLPLGNGRIDEAGLNRGLHELAGGSEICAYFVGP
jgi:cation diffusion facilitator CzcD-associated flavoprotein CzcO